MAFAGMNYGAVLTAALAGWFLGAAWYTTLARPWAAALGTTVEDIERWHKERGAAAFVPHLVAFVAELVMAFVLAGAIGHLGPGQVTPFNGVVAGAILWAGFVATTLAVNNIFGMRRPMLTLIDGAHWLAVLLVMGAVIGFMGV